MIQKILIMFLACNITLLCNAMKKPGSPRQQQRLQVSFSNAQHVHQIPQNEVEQPTGTPESKSNDQELISFFATVNGRISALSGLLQVMIEDNQAIKNELKEHAAHRKAMLQAQLSQQLMLVECHSMLKGLLEEGQQPFIAHPPSTPKPQKLLCKPGKVRLVQRQHPAIWK